jgi:AmmeMemoRadiSam system protein B
MQAFPSVRPVSPFQIPAGDGSDQPRYVLRDPAELAADQLLVTLPTLYLIELADGTRSRQEISAEFDRLTGMGLPEDLLDQLLERLDESYLLENERARRRLQEISPRPYRLSGSAYPSDRLQLPAFLDDLTGMDEPLAQRPCPRASILPHIDFFRGRDSYRAGYRQLRAGLGAATHPLTVVVLGISHAPSRVPFILTHKDFDTPVGLVRTDRSLVEQLSTGLPFDPFLDEYNHMSEHSVEFHAVLLRHLAGAGRELSIVPVLCGSFHAALRGRFSPRELPGVSAFLANLRRLKEERPDVHFLASVDLAHMGLNFEQQAMDAEKLRELEDQDRQTLSYLARGDADGFFATLQADRGIRNYCGTPAIYSLLDLFPEPFGMQHYQQCNDADLSSTVTVCAAIL